MHDYYEILQVSPKAEAEVIQAAYKRLVMKYHPDRNSDPQALGQMKLLNEAIGVLGDPQRRQEYDCVRAAGPEMRQKFAADAIVYGDDALARQDYATAIMSYSQALDYDPGLAKAYHNRGIAHASAGNFQQTIADFSEAIHLTPLDPVAYRNRARAYQALGDLDRAKADLEQADKLMPKKSRASAGPDAGRQTPSAIEATLDSAWYHWNFGPVAGPLLQLLVIASREHPKVMWRLSAVVAVPVVILLGFLFVDTLQSQQRVTPGQSGSTVPLVNTVTTGGFQERPPEVNASPHALLGPALGLTVDGGLEVVAFKSMIGGDNRAFKLGDRIVAVANVPVESLDELERIVKSSRPGVMLRVRVVRRDVVLELDIVLGRQVIH